MTKFDSSLLSIMVLTFIHLSLLSGTSSKPEVSRYVHEPESRKKGRNGAPMPHVGYVAMSRAQTHMRNIEKKFNHITLLHPLKPEDFEIPEIRRQRIFGEYERLRNLEMTPQATEDASLRDIQMCNEAQGSIQTVHNTRKSGLGIKVIVPIFNFTGNEEKLFKKTIRRGLLDTDVVANSFGIPITRAEIRGLAGKKWLNDDTINYIFSIWNERATLNDFRNFFVCTFFMDRLQGSGTYDFGNVRNYFQQGEDIKDNSILYIPVNISNTHWTLLVVDMMNKSLKYYDGLRGKIISTSRIISQYFSVYMMVS